MIRAIIIAAIIALAVPAQAQQSTFTDSSGRYSGSAITGECVSGLAGKVHHVGRAKAIRQRRRHHEPQR